MLRIFETKLKGLVRKKRGGSKDPFAVTLAGSTFYIITNPNDVNDVYNNTASLSFDGFLRDIMSGFGTSARGVEKILQRHLIRSTEKSVEKVQSISQVAHDLQVRQTQGKDLRLLGEYICEIFQQSLFLENPFTGTRFSPIVKDTDSSYIVSLQKWTAEQFIEAGQQAYFGEALSIINPGLPQTLIEFDNISWQVFYQYPKCLRRRLNKISGEILDSLRKYLEIPIEKRRGKAWFTTALEQKYREAGLTNEDIACQMLFLYWGQVPRS